MAEKRTLVRSKSSKPDNIVREEVEIFRECREMESQLPEFLDEFFIYLRGAVLPKTRKAYLSDIIFFMDYLVEETDITEAKNKKDITIEEFKKIKGRDVNHFLDFSRNYMVDDGERIIVYENCNRTLSRKKSSVSVMFRQLYRAGILPENITDSFDPIRVSARENRDIKALQDDEVMIMLDAVTTGNGLTKHQKSYWRKTKLRDKAILLIFLTYGLRLSELQQLNVSSFNFRRGEFIIYRKRGKESKMPLNTSVTAILRDYIENERDEEKADPQDDDALFLSLQGKRMTARQIRELVKKYTSIALHTTQAEGYSPHKLRATAATSLIGRGNSIYDVAALLDHEQVTTTQLYAKHGENVKRDLVKDMEWEVERRKK